MTKKVDFLAATRKCDFCSEAAEYKFFDFKDNPRCDCLPEGRHGCALCLRFLYMCDVHAEGMGKVIPIDDDYADWAYSPEDDVWMEPETACAQLAQEWIDLGVADLETLETDDPPVFVMSSRSSTAMEAVGSPVSLEFLEIEPPRKSTVRVARLDDTCDALSLSYGTQAEGCKLDIKQTQAARKVGFWTVIVEEGGLVKVSAYSYSESAREPDKIYGRKWDFSSN